MPFYTYILFSTKNNKYYTGQTNNLISRLEQHNNGLVKSTRNGSPWQLVFSEELITRSDAMRLETKIKKRGANRFLTEIEN